MKDSEILEGLIADVVSVLRSPEIPGIGAGRVLRSTSAEDFIFRDVEGQLPAIGVTDVDLTPVERVGIGSKKWKGRVELEIAVGAPAVGESSAEGRDLIRAVLGEVNKRLDDRETPSQNYRYRFLGFSFSEQQRTDSVVGVLRYEAGGVFGNE